MRVLTLLVLIISLCGAPSAHAYENAFISPTKKLRSLNLTVKNTITFSGTITPLSVNTFIMALVGKRVTLDPDQTMFVVIVSGGGVYESGLQLMGFINQLPNTEIICKYCASAAGMVFGTSKLRRLAISKSQLIMHEMFRDHVTAKSFKDQDLIDDMVKSSDNFNRIMYSVIGITKEDYEKKIIGTQWEVSGPELVKLHLADELVRLECDEYISRLLPDTCSK